MADRPTQSTPNPAQSPPTSTPKPKPAEPKSTDPKIILLEELEAQAVAQGRRDDPLTVRLHGLIAEMKGGKAPV